MPKKWFILSCCIILINNLYGQIINELIPIQNKEISPIGIDQFNWACVANFKLSDSKNSSKIIQIETDQKGHIYIADNNGYLYCLSGEDFLEQWKVKLSHEDISDMAASPDGKTIVICYNYIKAGTKKLEIINALNGRTLLKIKRTPACYEPSYLSDVVDNTTLYPANVAYSPDGSKLAIWFQNHGFDEKQCKANLEEQLVVINPLTGDVYASKREIPNDFGWKKCEGKHLFAFSSDGQSIYVSNCKAQIAQYKSNDLSLLNIADHGENIDQILTEQFHEKGSKKLKFPLQELMVQKDGSLITSTGKNGHIFKISNDLNSIQHITQNQGNQDGHFSLSPDGSMAMFNSNHINLWDIATQQPIFYAETPNAFDAHTVRFHPTKRALIVGTKRTIKIIAPCPTSKVHIDKIFTPTGHFLLAETSFSVRGAGKIQWAYGDKVIYQKYAKEQEISTENLGYSGLFNSIQNIPQSTELYLKTDTPGTYTIFGGASQPLSPTAILKSLANWTKQP